MEVLTNLVIRIIDGFGIMIGVRRIIIVSSAPEFIIKVR